MFNSEGAPLNRRPGKATWHAECGANARGQGPSYEFCHVPTQNIGHRASFLCFTPSMIRPRMKKTRCKDTNPNPLGRWESRKRRHVQTFRPKAGSTGGEEIAALPFHTHRLGWNMLPLGICIATLGRTWGGSQGNFAKRPGAGSWLHES